MDQAEEVEIVEKTEDFNDSTQKTLSMRVIYSDMAHQDPVFAKLKADGYAFRMLLQGLRKR